MKNNTSKYSQNSGFKVPEDYFRNFDEKMMNSLEDSKYLDIPVKGKAFSVPEGYFDSLEDKIVAKTSKDRPKLIKLFKKEYFYYAAAVAALFILMLGNFFNTESTRPIGWDNIELSAMENYIDEGYDMGYMELNPVEVSDFIFKDGKLIDDSDFTAINSDAVFDYIDENIEDPTYILE